MQAVELVDVDAVVTIAQREDDPRHETALGIGGKYRVHSVR